MKFHMIVLSICIYVLRMFCYAYVMSKLKSMLMNLKFQLASGEVFGPEQPIALKLLGSERSFQALEGKIYLIAIISQTDNPVSM